MYGTVPQIEVSVGGIMYRVMGTAVMATNVPMGTRFPIVPEGSDLYEQVFAALGEIDFDHLPECP